MSLRPKKLLTSMVPACESFKSITRVASELNVQATMGSTLLSKGSGMKLTQSKRPQSALLSGAPKQSQEYPVVHVFDPGNRFGLCKTGLPLTFWYRDEGMGYA